MEIHQMNSNAREKRPWYTSTTFVATVIGAICLCIGLAIGMWTVNCDCTVENVSSNNNNNNNNSSTGTGNTQQNDNNGSPNIVGGSVDNVGDGNGEQEKSFKVFADKGELRTAILSFAESFEGRQAVQDVYGEICQWNISQVTDFSFLFSPCTHGSGCSERENQMDSFDTDISCWDVSHVTNFWRTFYEAESFNQDLSDWNVSSGTSFNQMFFFASSFNQNLCRWIDLIDPTVELGEAGGVFSATDCPSSSLRLSLEEPVACHVCN